ncbi:MAG: DNA ligase D [Deltaproteobacteria bacterium]|nr:DNA ligase D [Deltaproteobacteria bacterium]
MAAKRTRRPDLASERDAARLRNAGNAVDALREYRAKRSAGRTPEPFGHGAAPAARPSETLRFVVQRHAARRMHHDFRLELDGVLKSWAVPKGPSPDPSQRRLAVQVEDHPIEYADFEGTIPEGNYGAGSVIVWDRGSWQPLEDPRRGLVQGKLPFELDGYKLRGAWTLVRTRGSGKDWLLIKKSDAWASPGGSFAPESVLSGLTLEELRDGGARRRRVLERLAALGAARRRLRAADVRPMLAEARDRPFSGKDWLFELKYDGFRLLVAREGGEPRLLYRRGDDVTARFPEIARAVRALPFDSLVMDGEVVVLDETGRPSFQRLQKRAQLARAADVERAAGEHPATAFLFDLVGVEGFDLRSLPLVERKEILRRIVPPAGALRYADHVAERGGDFFEEVGRLGLEGMVAKQRSSPYRAGRSADWIKVRREHAADFAIVGFTEPGGSRRGLGALHLAGGAAGDLRYAGRVGSGLDERTLGALRGRLQGLRRPSPPCSGPTPRGREHVWVEPELVCEVRFKERTGDGSLRQPVFLRLREDKTIGDGLAPQAERVAPPAPFPADDPPARIVRFTNLDKVFWPGEGYTKGDLIAYYRTISPWLLPYLRDRPLVLTRYPDGIEGKSFYQKDAPSFVPGWIRTERMWSEHAGREIDYFVCDDVESLLYLVNLGTIPIHLWSSRAASLERPDWCILDLDPKGAPFADVIRVARAIHRLCQRIELPSFVKTSGSTGLHVLIPLGAQLTYEHSRALGELLSRVVAAELPRIATTARKLGERGGKVYLDYLQNVHGQTIVAPFSVRPLAGAPASAPLSWSEVGGRLTPRRFTLRTLPARLRRLKADPLRAVLGAAPDLQAALTRLERLV